MLHINDLTYRIEGRIILDHATAGIPAGHKVGLVGRNGSGKTTLLRLVSGELHPDDGAINVPRSTRIGQVAQEAPGGPDSLIEFVCDGTAQAARRIGRVPWNDPATGVMRPADAGYEDAIACAKEHGSAVERPARIRCAPSASRGGPRTCGGLKRPSACTASRC